MSVTFIKNFCSFANQNGGGGFFLQRLGKFQFLHHQHSVCFFVLLLFFFSQNFFFILCLQKISSICMQLIFSSHHANARSGYLSSSFFRRHVHVLRGSGCRGHFDVLRNGCGSRNSCCYGRLQGWRLYTSFSGVRNRRLVRR